LSKIGDLKAEKGLNEFMIIRAHSKPQSLPAAFLPNREYFFFSLVYNSCAQYGNIFKLGFEFKNLKILI